MDSRHHVELPAWLDRAGYPFTPYSLDLDDGVMSYVDEGEGQPVLMVHGNPTWSYVYRHQVAAVRSTMRAVAPDHLGFGLSSVPERGLRPPDHAANLLRLVDELGLDDIVLVIQDWGGPIGLAAAIAAPHRIARLVICNTWAWPVRNDWYYQGFSKMVGGPVGRYLIRRRNMFVEQVMPRAFGDRSKLTPAIHDQYRSALHSPAKRASCALMPGAIIGQSRWLRGIEQGLPSLADRPVSVVWGMNDIAFRDKELQRWLSYFPHASVERLDGVGHFVQEEAPAAVNAAILGG